LSTTVTTSKNGSDGGSSGKAAYSRARDYRPRTQFAT
jgi:hypothetical protein